MSLIPWRVCALAALLPLSAAVYAAPADPTNGAASVPAAQYHSAFANYRPAVDESISPDQRWRAANNAVAAKPEEDRVIGMQMGGSMKMPMATGTAAPKASDKTMVMPDGTSMPIDQHQNKPMEKGMGMPFEKGIKAPADKGMVMPGGSTMPTDKGMTMPTPKDNKSAPDVSSGHDAKGH